MAAGHQSVARLRHQRQDHHHPAAGRRPVDPGPGQHQLGSAPTSSPGLVSSPVPRAGRRRRRPRGRRGATWPRRSAAVHPTAVVLLNLSRDQLDRFGEVRRHAADWRLALAALAGTSVVANVDDPLVTWAAGACEPSTPACGVTGSAPASAGGPTPPPAPTAAAASGGPRTVGTGRRALGVRVVRPGPAPARRSGWRAATWCWPTAAAPHPPPAPRVVQPGQRGDGRRRRHGPGPRPGTGHVGA